MDVTTLVSQAAETPLFERPAGFFLSARDGAVRRRLAADQYRFAEFTATSIDGLPARYVEGQSVKVRVPGNLTIRGVTRPAAFDTEATLQGITLKGTAAAQILMTDFGVDPPRSADGNGMDVEDQVSIVVQFTATASATQSPPPASTDRSPKLDATLAAVVRVARERGADEGLAEARQKGLDVEDGRVRLIISYEPPGRASALADAQTAVTAAGGEVEAGASGAVLALVPVSAIEILAEGASVSYLRTPLREEPSQ